MLIVDLLEKEKVFGQEVVGILVELGIKRVMKCIIDT
jgi:hypothetical protein